MNNKLYKLMKMLAKFETHTTVDGLVLTTEDGLNIDSEVFVENEDGELTPIADGEYTVENEVIVVVGGKIVEIKQTEINEETTTEEPETITEEMATEETEETTETTEQTLEEETTEPNTEVEELKAKIAELEAEKAELEAKIADLEAKLSEPIEEPIEDVFKATEPKKDGKNAIDFTKYINRKRK